jgi:prepilin-type N-terminal cleavage/methylation domain-containing protein
MKTAGQVLKQHGGFTFIELMVALLLGSVVMTALFQVFSQQVATIRTENARRAAEMTARGVLNFVVRNLEQLGRNPQTTVFTAANPAIQEAEDSILHYRSDLSAAWNDTDTTDSWEDVTFQYNGSTQTAEVVQGGTTTALSESSATRKSYVNELTFTYFDNNGNVVAPGGGAAARASIRRIRVLISVHGVVPAGQSVPAVTLSQDVFLRNV